MLIPGNAHQVPISIAATTDNTFDIFELIAPTTRGVALLGLLLTTDIETDPNELNILMRFFRFRGSYDAGTTGGAAIDAHPVSGLLADDTDASTINVGMTTPAAIGTGTSEDLGPFYLNNRVGAEFNWEADPFTALATDALVIGVNHPVAIPSTAFAGWVKFIELG